MDIFDISEGQDGARVEKIPLAQALEILRASRGGATPVDVPAPVTESNDEE
ncbi:MAG: hypothetical protein CAPSK01_001740 [Candidatus Accumulibacter vicinus]|uniref:Uncharacterized protein n=1 Tax=Candidatus Accumulibacter vicinus TaxID=2954382 RepID=A0A084Y2E1_9PROT|nr:MAG: hypothetical protein CAPSK01_001740 [Candidatus Accumulibacter vicinus]